MIGGAIRVEVTVDEPRKESPQLVFVHFGPDDDKAGRRPQRPLLPSD